MNHLWQKKVVGKYEDLMRNWTESTNNWTRFAGYLHERAQGKSFMESAANVKKYYFDYFDLTPFERKYMRRIVPFYTWTRKEYTIGSSIIIGKTKRFYNGTKRYRCYRREE